MSKSLAGIVSSSSSVPCRRLVGPDAHRDGGHEDQHDEGEVALLSWSRLARLALKNSFGQKAANALEQHEHADEHVARRIGEVADEVPLEDGTSTRWCSW